MAFTLHNLSVLAYANGFTLWHYRAGIGGLAAAVENQFFNDASDMLASGDMVMVSSPEGGKVLCIAPGELGMVTASLG